MTPSFDLDGRDHKVRTCTLAPPLLVEPIPDPSGSSTTITGNPMRVLLAILCVTCSFASAAAQGNQAADQVPGDSSHSTGRTQLPQEEQRQPQGRTGPLETGSGGAPAESPQGQTPPGMQAAPEGSSKTIVDTAPVARR